MEAVGMTGKPSAGWAAKQTALPEAESEPKEPTSQNIVEAYHLASRPARQLFVNSRAWWPGRRDNNFMRQMVLVVYAIDLHGITVPLEKVGAPNASRFVTQGTLGSVVLLSIVSS